MPYLFGSHVSCQGGLLRGVERAAEVGCDCLQVFVCQPRQWPSAKSCIPIEAKAPQKTPSKALSKAPNKTPGKTPGKSKPPTPQPESDGLLVSPDQLAKFQSALREHNYPAPIAHASYLINLGSSDAEQWNRSIEALTIEWQRSENLQLAGLVMHPGAHMDAEPEVGLANIVRGIELVRGRVQPRHCQLLLENTAGQGSCLGWRFEQLGWLLERLSGKGTGLSIGICFDTCHAYAAGYDFSTPARLKAMWAEFDRQVGLGALRAVHINDSQKGLGSRVDRHEHLGQGVIGEQALGNFVKSSPVKDLPMILETEKGINEQTGLDYDVENLAILRRITRTQRRPPLSKDSN